MMNQPSEEALRKFIRFLLKTSVPRIIKEDAEKAVESNENQSERMASVIKQK